MDTPHELPRRPRYGLAPLLRSDQTGPSTDEAMRYWRSVVERNGLSNEQLDDELVKLLEAIHHAL